MDAVLNNPFRVLGLKVTAREREITKRISDLLLYAEMGKKVKYESDLEFLGVVDRSTDSIKEATKRLENNDLKLFYSLMWFEINDDVDKTAFDFFKNNEYDKAITLLEEDIFVNSPIVYNPKGRLWGGKELDVITWGNMTTSKIKDTPNIKHIDYEIKLENEPPKGLQLVSLSKRFKLSTLQPKLTLIEESKAEISAIDKYQISLSFSPIQQHSKKIVLTILSTLENNIEFDFVIDFESGFSIIEKTNNSNKVIYNSKIDINQDDINTLAINNISNKKEILINRKKIFSFDNNYSFSSFFISVFGPIYINSLTLFELANRKLYSDIELNDNTTSRIKNLALLQLIGNNKDFRPKSNLRFFELYGKFYNQNYFDRYSTGIVPDNYKTDVPRITDLFVNEFYIHFKSGNVIDNDPELYFTCVFSYFSDEARKIADNKIMGQRVYEFEDLISKTTQDRLGKILNCAISAEKLYQSALIFFKWYSDFYGWQNINYMKTQEKVGNELLECGISYYNSSQQKIENAFVAINIIEQASEFARSLETRERIQKNINIISDFHGIEKTVIDFAKKDISNYIDSISFKGTIEEANPIVPKIETKLESGNNSSTESKISVNNTGEKKFSKAKVIRILLVIGTIISIVLLYYFLTTD